jgi:hypothetical protein
MNLTQPTHSTINTQQPTTNKHEEYTHRQPLGQLKSAIHSLDALSNSPSIQQYYQLLPSTLQSFSNSNNSSFTLPMNSHLHTPMLLAHHEPVFRLLKLRQPLAHLLATNIHRIISHQSHAAKSHFTATSLHHKSIVPSSLTPLEQALAVNEQLMESSRVSHSFLVFIALLFDKIEELFEQWVSTHSAASLPSTYEALDWRLSECMLQRSDCGSVCVRHKQPPPTTATPTTTLPQSLGGDACSMKIIGEVLDGVVCHSATINTTITTYNQHNHHRNHQPNPYD